MNNSTRLNDRVREVNPSLQIIVYSIIGSVSLLSNLIFSYILACTDKMKTQANSLLVNLAVSDLCIICVGLPLTIGNLVYDEVITKGILCQLQGFLLLVLFLTSNFNLTFIAIHRYVLIVRKPLYSKLMTRRRIKFGLVSTWICAIAISFPGWGELDYNFGRAHCMLVWGGSISYVLFVQMLAFTLPLHIIICCYYNVVTHSNPSQKRLKNICEENTSSRTAREYRLSVTLIIVVISFFTVFLPYALLIFWDVFANENASELHSFIAMVMAYSNSMTDFWIYALMNCKFRRAVISILCRKTFSNTT